ncbi:MAG: TonB-dependent receptor [Cytophagaceae bacterium]|jgi:TonB-dependent receptor|nr:TonB-dependent receptor [Cytophagaceae bacterium]
MYKIFLSLLVFLQVAAYAQTGTLKGIASDSTNSEALIGAVVSVVDNNAIGGVTDIDGSFVISNIPAGTYDFKISYLGYVDKVLTGVTINAGQTTDLGAITMAEEGSGHATVTVIGTRVTNSEQAVVTEVKESEQVVTAVSAEQISKSQDRDAAQVMQRVPGVTLIQNRFVMVRGLNQRYNSVLLNGAVAPSSESDSRAFSFDIIPSAMLDRLLIYKSGSAEMPGDFAGSVIKVYTRNTTSENQTLFNLTGGYRLGTTFNQMESQRRYAADGFGFGGPARGMPNGFPAKVPDITNTQTQNEVNTLSKSYDNDWRQHSFTVMPDLRAGLLVARKFTLGSVKVSSINNLTYSNTWLTQVQKRNFYWNYNFTDYTSDVRWHNEDTVYNNDVRLSLLSNWAFVINPKHKIEFRNMFSKMSSIEDTKRKGYSNEQQSDYYFTSLRYQTNTIYTTQLQGTHEVNNDITKLSWLAGYSYITRKEPNWRRYSYQRQLGTDDAYLLTLNNTASATNNARFSTDMKESSFTGGIDLEHGFKKELDSSNFVVRVGVFADIKSRTYAARWMSYSIASGQYNMQELESKPIYEALSDQYINSPFGLVLKEGTRSSDTYDANSQLMAGYAGFTWKFLQSFNLSAGLRVESFNQTLTSAVDNVPVKVDTSYISPLPSLNLAYNFNPKFLIRGAYFRSVNRPEFRELAPFPFYDFTIQVDRVGNPDLKITDIDNYDLRLEYYPGDGEMIAVGAFYKDFTNPIETYLVPAGSNFLFVPGNAAKANSYGVEVEIRKSLNGLTASTFLDRFSILFNGSLIKSQIKLSADAPGNLDRDRPMQGQAPWIINTGLYYFDDNKGINISLLYNVFGPRIISVGDSQTPSWYEMPRQMLDLTVSKDINEKVSFRFGISDILNSKIRIMEDGNFDEKLNNKTSDKEILTTNNGQYFTLGVNIKL